MVLPSRVMFACLLVNVAVQPALHSCPMEINDVCRSGSTCAMVAAGGSVGCSSSSDVWVLWMVVPFGNFALTFVLGMLLEVGVALVRKWLVHPVSRIAVGDESVCGVV